MVDLSGFDFESSATCLAEAASDAGRIIECHTILMSDGVGWRHGQPGSRGRSQPVAIICELDFRRPLMKAWIARQKIGGKRECTGKVDCTRSRVCFA